MTLIHVKCQKITLVPLLGPMGSGLGLGGSASAAGLVAAGGAAPSSAALTTSRELLLALLVLFFKWKNDTLFRLETAAELVGTLGVSTNPEAADAMLAMLNLSKPNLVLVLCLVSVSFLGRASDFFLFFQSLGWKKLIQNKGTK